MIWYIFFAVTICVLIVTMPKVMRIEFRYSVSVPVFFTREGYININHLQLKTEKN